MTKAQLIEKIRENGGKANMSQKKTDLESILASLEKSEPANPRICPVRTNSNHDNLCPVCHRCGGIVYVDPKNNLRCSCRNYNQEFAPQYEPGKQELREAAIAKGFTGGILINGSYEKYFMTAIITDIENYYDDYEDYFRYEDDSFDHEFGIERCGHFEWEEPTPLILNLRIVYPVWCDEIGDCIHNSHQLEAEIQEGLDEIPIDNRLEFKTRIEQSKLTIRLTEKSTKGENDMN